MTDTDPANALSGAQRERAAALRIARGVLGSGGSPLTKSALTVDVADLVDVAVYIIDGTHPHERYADDRST